MIHKLLFFSIASCCILADAQAQPISTPIQIDPAFGEIGLADIHSMATFSQDGQHLFTVTDRRVRVFRCKDGELLATIQLPNAAKSHSSATVRRLTIGLEGHHYCGRVLQGYQDVREDEGYVSARGPAIGPVKKTASHNFKMQFHHPSYLRLVHDGTKLLAGIAQREAFLIDTAELIRGENLKPEVLFRFAAKTELSSFAAPLDERRYVFFQEDVQVPETRVQSNGKTSDPDEQHTAGRLELFDLSAGEFVKRGAIELENPIPRKLRRRYQVFTLMEPESRDLTVRGIQVGCLLNELPPKNVEVPFRRFSAMWDEEGIGIVTYEKAQIIYAQPQVISPGLRFYVSAVDADDRRGFITRRLGEFGMRDSPNLATIYTKGRSGSQPSITLNAVFSPDDSIFAINDTASYERRDTKISIYGCSTREQFTVLPTGLAGSAYAVAFSRDNGRVLTITRGLSDNSQKAIIWTIEPPKVD